MSSQIFIDAFFDFLKVLPILVIAIIVSQIIAVLLPSKKTKDIFKENKKNIAKASVVGIMSPGPLLAYLPFLKTLKEKKVAVSLIAAFITGQTLIGPGRLFLELDYFGWEFFAVRVVLAFFIAVAMGVSFKFLERYIKY